MLGMSAGWKGSKVSIADVFHLLMYACRRSVVAIDSHLFQLHEEPVQIGFGILFVGCGFAQRLIQ